MLLIFQIIILQQFTDDSVFMVTDEKPYSRRVIHPSVCQSVRIKHVRDITLKFQEISIRNCFGGKILLS